MSDDSDWYRDAVIYQVHVRAFRDSDGDGIGDIQGLTEKLDYLQDLGVTAIWLLPFYPSPLKDDGYDIADYTDVNPSYGTLQDFRTFLREAHKRRPARHHRAGPEPHLGPAPVVPAGPQGPAGLARPRLLRLERYGQPVYRRAHHLQGLRALELDLGPRCGGLLLAPVLFPPAGSELRQPHGP